VLAAVGWMSSLVMLGFQQKSRTQCDRPWLFGVSQKSVKSSGILKG
jgi:hypothetical protein